MSDFNNQLNNIQSTINNIKNNELVNPLNKAFNVNNYLINRLNRINTISGVDITLKGDNIKLNGTLEIPNRLQIINNSLDDLIIKDNFNNSSCFKIDNLGRVGVNVNEDLDLSYNLFINGNLKVNGPIQSSNLINSLGVGNSIIQSGDLSNMTLSLSQNIQTSLINQQGQPLNINAQLLRCIDLSINTLNLNQLNNFTINNLNSFCSYPSQHPNAFFGGQQIIGFTNKSLVNFPALNSTNDLWCVVVIENPIIDYGSGLPIEFNIAYFDGFNWLVHPSSLAYSVSTNQIIDKLYIEGLVVSVNNECRLSVVARCDQSQLVNFNTQGIYLTAYPNLSLF